MSTSSLLTSRRGSEDLRELESLLQDLTELLVATPGPDDVERQLGNVFERIRLSLRYVRSDNDMEIICQEVLESHTFEESREEVLQILSRTDDKDPSNAYIIYSLLYRLGQDYPNTYRRLLEEDWHHHLKDVILERVGDRSHHVAVQLLYELAKMQELSIGDLETFDTPFLTFLLDRIEKTRDVGEAENYALIRLLLVLHEQFRLKTQFSASFPNRVTSTISSRINESKTLSENFVFMFNRGGDTSFQLVMIRFLKEVFESEILATLFYTNDTRVILDVILRETRNTAEEDEAVREGYILLLPSLLRNTDLGKYGYKSAEVIRMLTELRDSPLGRSGTRRVADRVLNEVQGVLGEVWC
ncbi:hypothetical protein HK097_011605 [Rhizophlyctis rosea]|uniref:SPIN90/Ldb17 leucine-rich domain-containing protein n=1 Tax=Rhizophlyctis rosea TaxID=64517 RepID=A0AAD5SE35_9FUNG|nr:hypothetical protein HK097_011605 [Rhizophlyctis rosea]